MEVACRLVVLNQAGRHGQSCGPFATEGSDSMRRLPLNPRTIPLRLAITLGLIVLCESLIVRVIAHCDLVPIILITNTARVRAKIKAT